MNFYWFPFLAAIVLMIVFVPFYLVAQRPGKCFKSLVIKMICSTMFLLAGLSAMKIADNTSRFAILMFVGLILSWFGDFFLHVKNTNPVLLTGLISFLSAHLLYIGAYTRAGNILLPQYKLITMQEVILIIAIFLACLIVAKKAKMKLGHAFIPLTIYTIVIATMLIKAVFFSLRYVLSGADNAVLVAILLITGAVFFFLSDATLAALTFYPKAKSFKLKAFNIVTYFSAQLMLASTILLIRA